MNRSNLVALSLINGRRHPTDHELRDQADGQKADKRHQPNGHDIRNVPCD